MPIFPYDDDDEGIYADYPPRRRPGMTPPVLGPDAAPLPSSRGIPGDVEMPLGRRQSRYGEMSEARDTYLQGTPGRGKSAILGAIRGALQGLISGQGALPGAVGGALGGAVDPRGMREQEFNRKIRPQIEERFGYEDQDRAIARQSEQDALNNQYRQAQTRALDRSNQPQPARPRPPVSAPGRGLYDPEAGGIIPGTEPPPPRQTPRPITFQGLTYDYNDPSDRAKLEAAQARLPRDKTGRFISRSDERATARANAPRQPKPKEDIKTIPISEVRRIAKEQGTTVDRVKARLVAKRIRVVE